MHALPTPILWLFGILAVMILLSFIPMPETKPASGKKLPKCPDCMPAEQPPPQHLLAWALLPDNLPKLLALAAVIAFGAWKEVPAMAPILAALCGSPVKTEEMAKDIFTLSLFGAVIMTGIAAIPVISFMLRGWNVKKSDIMSSLGPDSIALYVKTFLKKEREAAPSTTTDDDIFEEMYRRRYGRYRFREPMILLVVVLFPLSLLVSHTALYKLSGGTVTGSLVLPGEALAAISGAYTFVIAALVTAAMNYDLPPLMLTNSALRLLVAAPVGYAVASFGSGNPDFYAFAIGAFPIDTVQKMLGRLSAKYLNTSDNDPIIADSADKAQALDGVDLPMAENLSSGGITTATQLAYCDPVQLSLRTNIDFDVILDLQSEALAYIYLGGQLDLIRPLGLRGAVEIANLMEDEPSPPTPAGQPKSNFDLAFAAAQVAAKIDAGGLRNCFNEIAKDPYTVFLVESWACRNRGDPACPMASGTSGTASGTISGSSGSSGGAVTSSMASAVVVSGGSAIQSSGTAGSGAIASG